MTLRTIPEPTWWNGPDDRPWPTEPDPEPDCPACGGPYRARCPMPDCPLMPVYASRAVPADDPRQASDVLVILAIGLFIAAVLVWGFA